MDALGINWQYLLLQLLACVSMLILSIITAIMFMILVRALRPGFLTAHLCHLSAGPEGVVIPHDYLEATTDYDLRRYGKALLLLPKGR
jgi:hypothetical protein